MTKRSLTTRSSSLGHVATSVYHYLNLTEPPKVTSCLNHPPKLPEPRTLGPLGGSRLLFTLDLNYETSPLRPIQLNQVELLPRRLHGVEMRLNEWYQVGLANANVPAGGGN